MHVVRAANPSFQIELQKIGRDAIALNGMHHDVSCSFDNAIVPVKHHAVSIHSLCALNDTCITNKCEYA